MKSYAQLCPISSALDLVGSRWTMLILRDLFAGPARYVDLQNSLTGVASNLLTDRLRRLEEDGLIERASGPFDTTLYKLTKMGEMTRPVLEDLGRLGLMINPPSDSSKKPKSLRFLALALEGILGSVLPADRAAALGMRIDDEWFDIRIEPDSVSVKCQEAQSPQATAAVSFESIYSVIVRLEDPRGLRKKTKLLTGDSAVLKTWFHLLDVYVAKARAAAA